MSYQESHPHHHEIKVEEDLYLIEPHLLHAEPSLTWVESPDVIQYMGADFSNPTLEGETKRIQEILSNADEYSWMIEFSGEVIGNVSINSITTLPCASAPAGARAGTLFAQHTQHTDTMTA